MTLRVVKIDSRRGAREIERLRSRGRSTSDRKTMRRARAIVERSGPRHERSDDDSTFRSSGKQRGR